MKWAKEIQSQLSLVFVVDRDVLLSPLLLCMCYAFLFFYVLKNIRLLFVIDALFSIHRNAVNFVFKMFAWFYTGSHSMFAECIHSFADTTNQIILAYGIHKSTQVCENEYEFELQVTSCSYQVDLHFVFHFVI